MYILLKQKKWLVLLVILLSIFIVIYPAGTTLFSRLIGDGGDTLEYQSYFYIVLDNIKQGKLPFAYTTLYRYPFGFDFNLGSDAKLFNLVGGVLLPFCGGTVSYNLLFILILFLNCYTAYLLFTLLSGSLRLGLLGGIMYGLSYYVLAKGAGHINLMQTYTFPLLLYAVIKYFQNKKSVYVILIFLSISLSFYAAAQYGLIIVLCLVVYSLLGFLFYPKYLLRFVRSFSPTDIFTLLLCLVFFVISVYIPYKAQVNIVLLHKTEESLLLFNRLGRTNVVSWLSLITPNPFYVPLLHLLPYLSWFPVGFGIENSLYLGIVEIVLCIVGVISFIFVYRSKYNYFLIVSALISLFSLLGTNTGSGSLLPYGFIKPYFLFRLIEETQRFWPVFYLFFIGIIIQMLRYIRLHTFVYVCIFIIILLERSTLSYFSVSTNKQLGQPYQRAVSLLPGGGVLDLPLILGQGAGVHPTIYNILPFAYHKNIVEGYFNWFADKAHTQQLIYGNELIRFYCNEPVKQYSIYQHLLLNNQLLTMLWVNNIKTIVLHKEILSHDECGGVRKLALLLFGDISIQETQIPKPEYDLLMSAKQTYFSSVVIARVYQDNDAIVYQIK